MSKNDTSIPTPDGDSNLPSAETVESHYARLGAVQDDIDELIWLVDFARTQEIPTFAKLAKEIGVSEATVSTILRGKYAASIKGFCSTVRHFREVWTERQGYGPKIFVPELSVVKRISVFADLVRATQQIGIVWGDNQSGKSGALKYIAKQRKLTCYHKLPAGGACIPAMKRLAIARGGIGTRTNQEFIREKLLKSFNPQWLIIADEIHQTVKGRVLKTTTIDRYREFNDDCECGLLLCGTTQFQEALEEEAYRHFLGQIGNRGVLRLQIPVAPDPKDIELLVKAYGFEAMPTGKTLKKVQEIANERGIGALSKFFTVARRVASKAHTRVVWKHFDTTIASTDSWSRGEFAESKAKQLGNGNGAPKQLGNGEGAAE